MRDIFDSFCRLIRWFMLASDVPRSSSNICMLIHGRSYSWRGIPSIIFSCWCNRICSDQSGFIPTHVYSPTSHKATKINFPASFVSHPNRLAFYIGEIFLDPRQSKYLTLCFLWFSVIEEEYFFKTGREKKHLKVFGLYCTNCTIVQSVQDVVQRFGLGTYSPCIVSFEH